MPDPTKITPSEEQKAILAVKEDTIVISNPGTGKTTTLGFKVLDLLDSGVEPEEILCITFTDKAKKEMQDKLFEMAEGKYPESVMLKVNVSTFHAFARNYLVNAGLISGDVVGNNLLRYSIFESFIKNKAFHYPKNYIIQFLMAKVENAIRHMKSFGITHDKIDIQKTAEIIKHVSQIPPGHTRRKKTYTTEDLITFLSYFVEAYKYYESRKVEEIDYSDMMLIFLDKHQGEKFQHVLVDEMQDMNELQAEIVGMISENLFLVGDSKQAIFGFQGGSIKNFQKFAKQCKPMLLSTNRRSTQEILNYSKTFFIAYTEQKEKYKKELQDFNSSDNGASPKIFATQAPFGKTTELITKNPGKSIGVIARTNKQIIDISKYLDAKDIPYTTTTTQATTQDARTDLITFIKGILSDSRPEKITAAFSVFSPFSMQEAFEFSNQEASRAKTIPKLDSWKIALHRDDINKIFVDRIFPICISKGPEWFATCKTVKKQIDEYFALGNPTFEGLFDFIAIGQEDYPEQDKESIVTLTTIHKAKGREFDVAIYIPSMINPKASFIDTIGWSVFKALGIDLEDEVVEESLRMDFVAMTRAKEKLFIITDENSLGYYHFEKFSEFETDSNKEEKITTSSMNSRLTEAYSMFVAGKLKESQEFLQKKETWIKDFVVGYFKTVDHFYWSAMKLKPFAFLESQIIQMPHGTPSTSFGLDVHIGLQKILDGKTKLTDYKDDTLQAIKNGLTLLADVEKKYPGFKLIETEMHVEAPMSDLTNYTKNDGFYFSGKIDAVFEHNDGVVLVDWKTDRTKEYSSEHKRQLRVYKKLYSIKHKIPEDKIETCLIYVFLRGGINTGKIGTDIQYGHGSNVYSTFEGHIQKLLTWRDKPDEFLKELAQEPIDSSMFGNPGLQKIIKDKLANIGIK